MSSLAALLTSTGLFEVVSHSDDQCIGRTRNNELWIRFMVDLLRKEAESVEEGILDDNVISISKIYFIGPTGGVMYMWRVVCSDVNWLSVSFPTVEKADWAQNFKTTIGPDGFPKKVTLVSTTGKAKLPHPSDFGLGDYSEGVTTSE